MYKRQEQIRIAIDAALEEKPKDFGELLKKLEAAGIEVNRERKHLRFRVPGQENYTRCDTLKGDYTEQAIKERIAGTRTVKSRHTFSKKPVSKVGLLVDIEAAIRSGKGDVYKRQEFVMSEPEAELVKERMAELGITNLSAYLRKMAVDGYIIHLDMGDIQEMIRLLRICSNNLNQYTRRANETGSRCV